MGAALTVAVALSALLGAQPAQARTAPSMRPPRPAIHATFRTPTIEGGRARRPALRVIRLQRKMLRLCYEKISHARPGIGGTATLTFEIDERGAVRNAAAAGFDPDVDACLSGVTHTWQFAASANGIASVTQVIHFAARR